MPTIPQHTLKKIMGLARAWSSPIMALNRGPTTVPTPSRAVWGRARQSRPQTAAAAIASRSCARGPNRCGFGG